MKNSIFFSLFIDNINLRMYKLLCPTLLRKRQACILLLFRRNHINRALNCFHYLSMNPHKQIKYQYSRNSVYIRIREHYTYKLIMDFQFLLGLKDLFIHFPSKSWVTNKLATIRYKTTLFRLFHLFLCSSFILETHVSTQPSNCPWRSEFHASLGNRLSFQRDLFFFFFFCFCFLLFLVFVFLGKNCQNKYGNAS